MKYLLLAVFVLFSVPYCSAQHGISGTIYDTLNYASMSEASVVVLRANDSVMEAYTRASSDGSFKASVGMPGKYIVLITFPGYADYMDAVTVKDTGAVSIGRVDMVSVTHLLKEFVLTQQIAAIKINGDTTEYMADSFKVKDNATVEDLLKKMPGMQIDKSGNIMAQGEQVKKVLVDGEEFFSDDPKVVTKNLQSDIVERVQVYDKKSDQAMLTGVGDGQKEKTINLQLKADRKKGYFGKVDAGVGTDGYYQDQAMINDFKGKEQVSVFGIASNTDQVGLGWADNEKYSSSNMVTQITDGGDVINYFSSDNSDFSSWDGSYTGQGLPQVLTGGVHYADKWNEDADHVTGNYRYALQNININSNSVTENLLPGNVQDITTQNIVQSSRGERHNADGMFEWKPDTTSSIKFTVNGGTKSTSTASLYNTVIDYDDPVNKIDSVINTTMRKVTSQSTSLNFNNAILYQKKFKKKGRTLTLDMRENYKNAQSSGYLNSSSVYAAGGDSIIDQRKQINSNTLAFAGKAIYTEPISKVASLVVNYGLSVNNSATLQESFNKPAGSDQYNMLDSLYSSNYKFNVLTNKGGLGMHFVYDKVNFSFGTDVSDARYLQTDLLNRDTTYRYNYFNLFPKASFNYKISKATSFNFSYQGSTTQPTIAQVAPLHQNTDPLNIEVGNPGLRQQFQNNFDFNFRNFRVISGSYFYLGANASFINNAISTAQNTDAITGVRTYQYINVSGNYTGSMYFGYNFRIKKLNVDMGPDGNISVNHTLGYIDGMQNISTDNSYTLAYSINYNIKDKFNFREHPSYTYSDNQASVSTFNANYGQFYNNMEASYNLPVKFEVGSDFEWWLRQRTAVFTTDNSIFKWNAYVAKKLLANDRLEFRATIFDILNQNTNLTRSAQNNIITQQESNTIRRHGMLSIIWNFSKTPAADKATEIK